MVPNVFCSSWNSRPAPLLRFFEAWIGLLNLEYDIWYDNCCLLYGGKVSVIVNIMVHIDDFTIQNQLNSFAAGLLQLQ